MNGPEDEPVEAPEEDVPESPAEEPDDVPETQVITADGVAVDMAAGEIGA